MRTRPPTIPRMAKQTTTCSVEGCDAPTRSRGWCRAHYSRWYRWGDPLIVKVVPSDPATAAERRREKSRRDARSYRSRRNGKSWQSPDGLCNKCKEHPHTATSGYCRSCLATAKRELRQRPGQREKIATWQRAAHLRHAYSLTVEEYDALLASQGGVCAMCGKPPAKNRLAVDHDHETGRIRGLLCRGCNGALGWVDARGIAAIRAYLIPEG